MEKSFYDNLQNELPNKFYPLLEIMANIKLKKNVLKKLIVRIKRLVDIASDITDDLINEQKDIIDKQNIYIRNLKPEVVFKLVIKIF